MSCAEKRTGPGLLPTCYVPAKCFMEIFLTPRSNFQLRAQGSHRRDQEIKTEMGIVMSEDGTSQKRH